MTNEFMHFQIETVMKKLNIIYMVTSMIWYSTTALSTLTNDVLVPLNMVSGD